jgi:glucose-6-phosphate dehydrogenase assembly protein OpcA
VSEDVWSERDTTPDAIDAALRRLLHERHSANEHLAPARVLNLIVVVDRSWKGEISNRLERVGRYNASRTILCTVEAGRDTLDAHVVMAYGEPEAAGLSVIHEQVEIDMGPTHLRGLETIVDPVIVSELPTMLWCPHGHEEAIDALRGMIDVMLLDSDGAEDANDGLSRAHDLTTSAYIVDLAWLRTTPWRERLAASFDLADRRPKLASLSEVTVRHQPRSEASSLLLMGWLASRLKWEPQQLASGNGSGTRGLARRGEDQIQIKLEPHDLEVPGLVGVTVAVAEDFSLSLDRGQGGLRAREHFDGHEHEWQVLGASRGEGGILGEGVRQALLRDPTYRPALDAARAFCP